MTRARASSSLVATAFATMVGWWMRYVLMRCAASFFRYAGRDQVCVPTLRVMSCHPENARGLLDEPTS
ncbi:hypothetical protein [Tateyamaria sp. Alg231-49]|uniref:hypothetical protein n=1 Tax=Tateyamaria sp. Alg231-49 TaxID=1922219 RepID=UPI00131EDD86|nr:hypothetical protein [Tateyamaria sp. Alg231-49]